MDAREPGRRPAGLGDERAARLPLRREDAAAAHRARALRLREDRRGLRHGLHLLRDPAVPRQAPEPAAQATSSPRSRGSPRRGIQEAILVSQDTLAYGRDLPGNGDIGDLLLALSDTRDAVDPADVSASRARQRPPRGQVGARARRAVPRHAGAARRRRRSSAPCAARSRRGA